MDFEPATTVQGIIVRANDHDLHHYLVLWSPKFNHSFIYRDEIDHHIWTKSSIGSFVEYDVLLEAINKGPELIETKAVRIRPAPWNLTRHYLPHPSANIFRREGSSVTIEDIYDLRDADTVGTFKIVTSLNTTAFIRQTKLAVTTWEQCLRTNCRFVQAISRLQNVAKKNETYPWIIISCRPIETMNMTDDRKKKTSKQCKEEPCKVPQTNIAQRFEESGKLTPKAIVHSEKPEIMKLRAPTATSIYFSSTQQKQNEMQRRHHLASLHQNVIQQGSIYTGLNAIVPEAKPLEALDKEVSTKMKLFEPVITALVITEQIVHPNIPVWVLYSRDYTSEKNPYIRICKHSAYHFKIGSWYSVGISIPETDYELGAYFVRPQNIVKIKPEADPETVIVDFTYEERSEQNGKSETAFVICRADQRVYMNKPRLENRFLGVIQYPDYVFEFIDFTLMKECIVEAVPGGCGWEAVRFHGIDPDLPKRRFPKSLKSYLLACQKNNVDANLTKADIISPDCVGHIWLRNSIAVQRQNEDEVPLEVNIKYIY